MQARVTCPACQTALGVSAAHGEGTVLRCPQCRHEFAIRLRPPAPSSAGRPASGPLSAPLPSSAPRPAYRLPVAQPQARGTESSGSLLWIGIGAGAAIAVSALVLMVIVMRLSAPTDNPENAAQEVAAGPASQAGEAVFVATAPASPTFVAPAAAAAPVGSPSVGSAPSAGSVPTAGLVPAAPAANSVSTTTPPSQPASSIAPRSPFSPPDPATALPPTPPAAPAPNAPLLAYRFNGGEEYAYSFSVKADVAGTANQTNGMCTLTLSREAPPAEFAAHEKTGQGNGSGFVVTSDGYVVTCAHVVEGSTKLEVVLGTQAYPAQVVAFDKERDLAVVRIVATNLPTVSLANSDAVQLAEEVRAVGYPLSNLLGESVKITRGTIAGVVNTSGRKLFQVDASINPGNSGGPLVNEMGQVVGVASAKLAREDIDGVGFAVPAGEVLSLLRSKGISPASSASDQKLDGPALARRVTPAVALVRVTVGPGGYGAANRLVLDFSGHVTSSGPPRVVGRVRMSGIPSAESDRGKLLVSERGEIIEATGNVQLPYLLGPVGTLAIEPLTSGEQRTWQTQRATVLTQIIGQESASPFSMRFRHRSRFGQGPFAQNQTKVVVTPAIETSDYELAGTNGDVASIKKRYTFQTLDPAGSPPVAKMTGEGTISFNRAKGYAEKMEYKATLLRSTNNVSVTVPLTMEWRRLSQGELNQMRAQAKANLEAAQKAGAERAARAAKANIGEDTEFVGGSGGASDRFVDETSLLHGVECRFSQWMGEQCVNEIVPIFARDQKRTLATGAVAKDGYAVGAAKVYAGEHVNGIQLIFMRVRDGGQLDPKDAYSSSLLGVRGLGKPHTLTGGGAPIIGIHLRHGAIVDALALVVNRDVDDDSDESENPFKPSKSTKTTAKRRPSS